MDPFLTYASHRPLREQVWRTYYNRGDNDDAHDNNAIIAEILRLRSERAKMLGYATHAHWRLEPQMAKTPEAAMELMLKVWPKAVAACARRSGRYAGDRHGRGRRNHDRAVGLPLLCRKGAEGQVRSGLQRSEAVSATRETPRSHDVGRRPAVRAAVQASL